MNGGFLKIGPLSIWPPVILAPMAGVTNYPFRKLCLDLGAGLAISEMVTAHSLIANHHRTQKIATFYDDGYIRSIQLYGVDPKIIGQAVKYLREHNLVDHIDLNFGCPVKKITSKGGGAALPYKTKLLQQILAQAVHNAEDLPVTIKFRMGINDDYLYYLETGKIAQEEGISAVTLHARTAQQLYSGAARWEAIAELKQALCHIPVLGNGDLHTYHDIAKMYKETNCDGFVIGRGCLGKPWLFADIKSLVLKNHEEGIISSLDIIKIMLKHFAKEIEFSGEEVAMKTFRKHLKWYVADLPQGEEVINFFLNCGSSALFLKKTKSLIMDCDINKSDLSFFKGKQNLKNKVSLPKDFLLSTTMDIYPVKGAEVLISGG